MIVNRQQTASDLLNEKNLRPQMLLENHVSVALELRRCSLTTIPAEFPDADAIAKAIDLTCIQDYRKVSLETDVRQKAKLIRKFRDKLRKAFQENIRNAPSYVSHVAWTNRLNLQVFEVEVRPTVRELFLYRNGDAKSTLAELSARRTQLREELLRSIREPLPRSVAAYPEEYSPDYVLRIGELLSYPKCCIEAYVKGRTKGNVLAEERAFRQIRTLRSQGLEPDLYAYFTKDFIPCNPSCVNAVASGRKLAQGLENFDHRLYEFYIQCLKTNITNVESYVERIEAHKEKMKALAQELGIQTLR